MNKSNLKSYAPQARKDFIAAVTARAHLLGLDDHYGQLKVAPSQTQGDVTVIAGQAWPAKVDGQRQQLIARMQREGFAQTVEAVAYTWFNRFAALRYMELHDYLGHGHRALSSSQGGLPEILARASELAQAADLPGLKVAQVNELKLAGNRDGELYRLLLIAQCNALHQAMPFLFERIDDETELLLPDNLLLSDSLVVKLVAEIPEEDWAEVEIIGWLYQFYISEKKDQVIGKVVKSEDIPAATQLFTPNWIVQYLVQNSVGRLWLMANQQSTLAKEWPYYITPAEQTPEVQAQLDALIQTRVREDGDTLNPESITVLDPACGSGHILVVAYDVLKAIYLERGYQPRAIPRLILEKNLYGLDIDDRAAQMAGFALLMKARADDRRLFTDPPRLNVMSLRESKGLSVDELATHLAPFNVQRATISALMDTFEHAKTFGSLIQIPYALKTHLAVLPEVLALVQQSGDLYARAAADDLLPLVRQSLALGMQLDAVVANPPYMGGKGMNPALKDYAKATFPDSKSDLFAMFMERGFEWCKPSGFNSMVTMQSWMFLSSYEAMREKLLTESTLSCMVHMGNGVMGIAFGTAATVMLKRRVSDYAGSFSYCEKDDIGEEEKPNSFPIQNERLKIAKPDDFQKIPGNTIAYWLSDRLISNFETGEALENFGAPTVGLQTSNNGRFVRFWHEVSVENIGFDAKTNAESVESMRTWFPYNKGGAYCRWYGNHDYVVNWKENGSDIKTYVADKYPYLNGNIDYVVKDRGLYFRESISYSKITSGAFCVRWFPSGFVFDVAGASIFVDDESRQLALAGLLNSCVANPFLQAIAPTLNLESGQVAVFPVKGTVNYPIAIAKELIEVARISWNLYESSWSFSSSPLISGSTPCPEKLRGSWDLYVADLETRARRAVDLEEKNNIHFLAEYSLQEEISPEVSLDQMTLARANREKDSQRLVSYAIGCMMGRYSLDEPGLIYAHAGNVGFDPSRYEKKFPADADGIVPLTDEPWFTDDAASRVREFLRAVWGPDTLEENIAWLAESLGVKGSETPDETIRRYLADKFFKDHLQTYKKRPIYWLFSSGKQGAFQALVYLHRYHEGTLARLRAEYVVPLTGKMQVRLDMLQKDAQAATSTAARNKISKEIEKLKKKHAELLAYDEKLRHHADMRIQLDLDDGVKVNYGKFGDLLAEVKAVTGGASDD